MAERIGYSIPKDGEKLEERHLREQSVFLLSEAGGAWRDAWGVFRPREAGDDVNHVSIERDKSDYKIVVRKLAAVSPDGFVLQSHDRDICKSLSADASASSDELVVCVRPGWTGERTSSEWIDRGPIIEFYSKTKLYSEDRKPGCMEIARIDAKEKCVVTAPALGMDATGSLCTAWAKLCKQIEDLAKTLGLSHKGEPFARSMARSALDRVCSLPRNCDPRQAGWELTDAFRRFDDFVKMFTAVGDGTGDDAADGARRGARQFAEAAVGCYEAAGGPSRKPLGTSRLVERVSEFTKSLEIDGAIGSWLTTEAEELTCKDEIHDIGNYIKKKFEFKSGSPAKKIRVEATAVDSVSRPSIASLKFDDGEPIEYKRTEADEKIQGKICWSLDRPSEAREVTIRCPRHTKIEVFAS